MEAREILQGNADVLVCDGFSGNILLKAIEGVATTFFSVLKEEIKTSYISQLGGLLIKSHLKKFKKKFDYSEHGGAPFLGIKRVCIKCHGSSDASAIKNAILKGETYVEKNIIESFIKEFSDEGAI
jgi:glycerol-3-phosphate acyltransferase PlsX